MIKKAAGKNGINKYRNIQECSRSQLGIRSIYLDQRQINANTRYFHK